MRAKTRLWQRCFWAVVAVLVPSMLLAQAATATLSGAVPEQTLAAVPDVRIVVINDATALRREVTTRKDGTFTIPLLPPGRYRLRASRAGFSPLEMTDLVLNVGDHSALTLRV